MADIITLPRREARPGSILDQLARRRSARAARLAGKHAIVNLHHIRELQEFSRRVRAQFGRKREPEGAA